MIVNIPIRICIIYERINIDICQETFEIFILLSSQNLCDEGFILQHESVSYDILVSITTCLGHQVNILPLLANTIDKLLRFMKKLCHVQSLLIFQHKIDVFITV